MEAQTLYVIKSSDGKYWKRDFPYWVARVIHCTPITYRDGQDKIEELEKEVDFLMGLELLEKERKITER
ncbi:hypothetical protein COJ21_26910 [Priestia megaterium]|uniref:hypothetical protein n=1 Tax=Priestia megaterium TaxID=1404 RepID=UPI000BF525E1|nr:hypothetical protein [Priestia megaterium]PFK63102.1 hypothetical protein COJ21_26910 [Priestia megaterium]